MKNIQGEKKMGLNTNKSFSPFIPLFLLVSLPAIIWLRLNEVKAGNVFFIIMVVGIVLILLTWLFFREQKLPISEPFQTTFTKSAIAFTILALIPILIFGFTAGSIVTANSFVPLSAQQIVDQTNTQNFASVQAEVDPTWRLLTITGFAPGIEEFVFGFAVLFFLYGIFHKTFKEKRVMPAIASITISALFFSLVHQLNGDYVANPIAFLYAFIFRVVLNILILYNPAVLLAGTIGFHFGNNFIWYVNQLGWTETLIGMTSPVGLAFYGFITISMIIGIVGLFRGKVKLGDFLEFKSPGG